MKRKLLIAFLILSSFYRVQAQSDQLTTQMAKARKLRSINPAEAFKLYEACAAANNAEAMNALGVFYSKGVGVTMNETQAINWFEKAGNAGYAEAWNNLGLMYKNGLGSIQDFSKAFASFSKAAATKSHIGYYWVGFMYYKGLGCQQSYESALQNFRQGAAAGELGSMYMIGLCFRNGYGVSVNADSARFWLTKSADKGYHFAKEELREPQPENKEISQNTEGEKADNKNSTNVPLKSIDSYKKVKGNISPGSDLNGDYQGYIIKFDWSGKHVVQQDKIDLHLSRDKKSLQGILKENGTATSLNGIINDTSIVFSNTTYAHTDHYNKGLSPNQLEFKSASLQFVQNSDTVLLSGNLSLYSTKLKEPGKPMYLILMKTNSSKKANLMDSSLNTAALKTDSLHFVAYPNPFNYALKVNYTLQKASTVRFVVSDMLTARIIYKSAVENVTSGDHSNLLQINGSPGTYVITLIYGDKLKSAVIFKN